MGAIVNGRPGVWSGQTGPMKSSEKQNIQAKGPSECTYTKKTAMLLRNIARQVPAWNTVKPQMKERKDPEKDDHRTDF